MVKRKNKYCITFVDKKTNQIIYTIDNSIYELISTYTLNNINILPSLLVKDNI